MDRRQEDTEQDSLLAGRARDGDVRAFEELLARHEARVLRVLGLLGVPRGDREDVAQEVFIRVFRHLGGFRPGRSFAGWVYRITVNAAHDHRARVARIRRDESRWDSVLEESADRGPGPGDRLDRQDVRSRLEWALQRLSERERAVFVLCELEELETRDVARSLGITAITVRRHLGRARGRLREILAQGDPEKKSGED